MTNTHVDMLSRPATGLKVVAYQRDCGWHVLVSETKPSKNQQTYPRIVAKSCVPLYDAGDRGRVMDQLRAIVLGVHNITRGEPETCTNL